MGLGNFDNINRDHTKRLLPLYFNLDSIKFKTNFHFELFFNIAK
jgi:hypothetical protein